MKNLLALPALAILCMMLAGCPYESEFPLDQTRALKIDSSLLGTWCKYNSADGALFTTVIFEAKSAKEYRVTVTKPDLGEGWPGLGKNGIDTFQYLAYSTLVAGQGVYTCTDSSGKYFFAVIQRPERNRISIKLLPDVMIGTKHINSADELKTYITRYLTSQAAGNIAYENDAWLNNLAKLK